MRIPLWIGSQRLVWKHEIESSSCLSNFLNKLFLAVCSRISVCVCVAALLHVIAGLVFLTLIQTAVSLRAPLLLSVLQTGSCREIWRASGEICASRTRLELDLFNSISVSWEDVNSYTVADIKSTPICKCLSRLELQQLFKCLINYSSETPSIIHFSER